MIVYRCDNTFEGVLTSVFEAFRLKENPEIITSGCYEQTQLGAVERTIITDPEKSDRVYQGIAGKISEDALEQMYSAWLSEETCVPTLILKAVREGFRVGGSVMRELQNPDILQLHSYSRRVMKEVHLFLGLLRFKKTANGIYYAGYEPDSNITELITPHFVERFSDQIFFIHDISRKICAVHQEGNFYMTDVSDGFEKEMDRSDVYQEKLWQEYFRTAAVKDRLNAKNQKSFMPVRYWKHLVEKNP